MGRPICNRRRAWRRPRGRWRWPSGHPASTTGAAIRINLQLRCARQVETGRDWRRDESGGGKGHRRRVGGRAEQGSAHLIGADLWPETAAAEGLVRVVEIEKEREGEGAAGAWVAGGGRVLGAVARCGPP